MKALVVLALAVLVLAGVLFIATRAPAGLEVVGAPVTPGDASPLADGRDATLAPALVRPGNERAPAERAESAGEPESQEAALAEEELACRIFGRVVDTSGNPLADVPVELCSVGCKWTAGATDSRFDCTTRADGRFEVRTPLPTCDWISLDLEPSRYHSRAGRDFGLAGGRNKDPLVAGDNDLGTFTLGLTGAIAGMVRSTNGASLGKAWVRIVPSPGISGQIGASGRYVIAHVPPGTYAIESRADGFLIARLTHIEVVAGATSQRHDLVLEPSPVIAGVVLDEEGAPVEDVRVGGYPLASGMGASDRTDAEGRFEVYLPQDESYALTAEKAGYVTFGETPRKSAVYEPGTRDLTIHLVREVLTRFLVVDARTGAPVERFGLKIDRKPNARWFSSTEGDELPPEDRPGGELTIGADPDKHAYSIQAPGYGPQREPVVHEAPDRPHQTIRLEPEARIRGRVLFESEPVAGATVRIRRGSFRVPRGVEPLERDFDDDDYGYDLGDFTGRLRILSTDERGRFELGGLAAGTYRANVSGAVGGPYSAERQRVLAGEVLDLGDVVLPAASRVHGRVIVGVDASAPGLVVHLGGRSRGGETPVDAEGRFAFGGVSAGPHTLVVADAPGIVIGMDPVRFELEEGETREIDLDLRPFEPAQVHVRVVDIEGGLEGAKVSVSYPRSRVRSSSGATDEHGEVQLEVRGGIDARLDVRLGPFRIARKELVTEPGETLATELHLETGELGMLFPDDYELPENGRLLVNVKSAIDPAIRLGIVSIGGPASRLEWSGPSYVLGRVPAGLYDVKVALSLTNDGRGWIHQERGFAGTVEVPSGGAATCVLDPR